MPRKKQSDVKIEEQPKKTIEFDKSKVPAAAFQPKYSDNVPDYDEEDDLATGGSVEALADLLLQERFDKKRAEDAEKLKKKIKKASSITDKLISIKEKEAEKKRAKSKKLSEEVKKLKSGVSNAPTQAPVPAAAIDPANLPKGPVAMSYASIDKINNDKNSPFVFVPASAEKPQPTGARRRPGRSRISVSKENSADDKYKHFTKAFIANVLHE